MYKILIGIFQALSKADQAKKKATASSDKVQTALESVRQILNTLSKLYLPSKNS